MAVTHYLEALDFQKEIMKTRTILGGKDTHPNWTVGGTPSPINVDGVGGVGGLNMVNLNQIHQILKDQTQTFIDNVYIPDILAIGQFYKGWLYGGGISGQSVLAYGDIPDRANDYSPENLLMPSGAIINGNSRRGARGRPARSGADPGVRAAFLVRVPGRREGPAPLGRRHRAELRRQHRQGHAHNIEELDENASYSWIKAPRWRGMPWRWARSRATSSATRRATRKSPSRSTSC